MINNSFINFSSEKSNRLFLSQFFKNSGIINSDFFGLNFISNRASDVALFSLGIKTNHFIKTSKPFFSFVIGDNIFEKNVENTFVCYQGIQGNEFALKSNIILSSNAFTEKNALFVNIEGRFQSSQKAFSSPKNAKSDFDILFNILNRLDKNFNMKLKQNFLLQQTKVPFFKINSSPFYQHFLVCTFINKTKITNKNIITTFNNNNYQSNLLLKGSISMAKSSKLLLLKSSFI